MRAIGATAVVMTVLGVGVASAGPGTSACGSAGPINDNYLCSLELNTRGAALNDTQTLVLKPDTTNASVQANLFNPCGQTRCPSGPPEITSFNGVSYGKTVWYDFYPDKNGIVHIQTAGFDAVICAYQFNTRTFVPDSATRRCENQSLAPLQQSIVLKVNAGVAYTVQIGGVVTNAVPASGALDVSFDYFPSKVGASAHLKAVALSTGIRIFSLNVSASQATHITVRCSGGCAPETKKGGRNVSFPRLKGATLVAGSKIMIFATKKATIGTYIQFNVFKGNFSSEIFRCLEPGSMTPRRSCH